ncbi:hypothetical protein TorRG33x02_287620, partial [Trema orientale]
GEFSRRAVLGVFPTPNVPDTESPLSSPSISTTVPNSTPLPNFKSQPNAPNVSSSSGSPLSSPLKPTTPQPLTLPGKEKQGRVHNPELCVYSRRAHKQKEVVDIHPLPMQSIESELEATEMEFTGNPDHIDELDKPIALRKGIRSCTLYPISKFVSYHRLSPFYKVLALIYPV